MLFSSVDQKLAWRDYCKQGLALAVALPLLLTPATISKAEASNSNKHSVKINSFIPTTTTTFGSSPDNGLSSEPLQPEATVPDASARGATALAPTPVTTLSNTTSNAVFQEPDFTSGAEESGWSLPILGRMSAKTSLKVTQKRGDGANLPEQKQLEGSISSADSSTSSQVDRLMDAALDRDSKAQVIDRAVSHFRKPSQIAIAQTKDAADYVVPFRGFGPSSEAGDIILDEKVKLKSRASAEYARQKHIDELHLKIVSNMMQMAMGLGMSDQRRGEDVTATGFNALKDLVGEEEAAKTRDMLLTTAKAANVDETVYSQEVWDVSQKQDKHKLIVETSLEEDPVVHEIKKRLHKYNQHSKFSMAASHVIGTTLGAASLTPTFIGPAAKLALLTYIMATGGPEQVKLLKELYLDKRFESRCKVVNEEAHLALDNYQLALLTRNPVLLNCAESILGQMVPEDTVRSVCGGPQVAEAKTAPGA